LRAFPYLSPMKLYVQPLVFNPFQENTYVVYNELREAVIIDPGCSTRHEQQVLIDFLNSKDLTPLALLNTHAHIDHVLGNAFVLRTFSIDLLLHELDLPTLRAVSNYAHLYGIDGYEPSPDPDRFITDGEKLVFGSIEFDVIFGPGHAPGHVAFYNAENSLLMGGDILFQGSYGRVDLPGGSMEVLKRTIFEKIFTLPEDTVVYPGHGPATQIGVEKVHNYILQS